MLSMNHDFTSNAPETLGVIVLLLHYRLHIGSSENLDGDIIENINRIDSQIGK